jgi:hypothetical protein
VVVIDDEYAEKLRQDKLHELEGRLGKTESGWEFICRVKDIGRPKPIENLPSQQRKQGE